jgi:hypothetical protein
MPPGISTKRLSRYGKSTASKVPQTPHRDSLGSLMELGHLLVRTRVNVALDSLGSNALTIGIVEVARFAAAAGVPAVMITSTLRPISSAASPGSRSFFPSAARASKAMFWPSI